MLWSQKYQSMTRCPVAVVSRVYRSRLGPLCDDFPQTTLLVTPATHPIYRLIEKLEGYRVDARPLGMLSPIAGRNHMLNGKGAETTGNEDPILFVSTLTITRGLDLPNLSHVRHEGAGRQSRLVHPYRRTDRSVRQDWQHCYCLRMIRVSLRTFSLRISISFSSFTKFFYLLPFPHRFPPQSSWEGREL